MVEDDEPTDEETVLEENSSVPFTGASFRVAVPPRIVPSGERLACEASVMSCHRWVNDVPSLPRPTATVCRLEARSLDPDGRSLQTPTNRDEAFLGWFVRWFFPPLGCLGLLDCLTKSPPCRVRRAPYLARTEGTTANAAQKYREERKEGKKEGRKETRNDDRNAWKRRRVTNRRCRRCRRRSRR